MDESESLKEGESEESAPASLLQRLKDGCSANGYQISVSFWSTLAFLGLGSALAIFGPTLLDLAAHLRVGVGVLSIMLILRGMGSILGCVVSGILLDRLEMLSFLILSVSTVGAIITTALLPVPVYIALLAVIIFFQGAMLGGIDNGVNSTVMKMWKQKAGPSLQCIYFGQAVGGFIAPLIARPFLSTAIADTVDVVTNVSCHWIIGINMTYAENYSSYNDSNSNISIDVNSSGYVVPVNCTPPEVPLDIDLPTPSLAWAYMISASLFIVPLVAFLYYAIRLELWKSQFRRRRSSIRTPIPEELKNPVEGDSQKTNVSPRNGLVYKFAVFSLLFLFLFFFEGVVTTYGTLIFTTTVTGQLRFGKDEAAHLTSVFWAAFAFVRIVPIILTLLKVPTIIIMAISIIGSLISTTLMIMFPHDPVAIWIGSTALGASMSPASPTAMTLFNEYIEINGKATAVLVTGGALGESILPAVVGLLIAHVSPDTLFYGTFLYILLSGLLMAILFVTNFVHSRKQSDESEQYEKLN